MLRRDTSEATNIPARGKARKERDWSINLGFYRSAAVLPNDIEKFIALCPKCAALSPSKIPRCCLRHGSPPRPLAVVLNLRDGMAVICITKTHLKNSKCLRNW
jgi:hypothetical protein